MIQGQHSQYTWKQCRAENETWSIIWNEWPWSIARLVYQGSVDCKWSQQSDLRKCHFSKRKIISYFLFSLVKKKIKLNKSKTTLFCFSICYQI